MQVPSALASAVPAGWRVARFERRRNRFAADVALDGASDIVHVPNTARLPELLLKDVACLLEPADPPAATDASHARAPGTVAAADDPRGVEPLRAAPGRDASSIPRRRTRWTLRFVASGGGWISIDAQVPNRIVGRALADGALPEVARLAGPDPTIRREVRVPWGRVDFVVEGPSRRIFLEVKSSSLVRDGWAFWPDSPTERGVKHVKGLAELGGGDQGMVLFVVQRPGARGLSPNRDADPAFADAVAAAVERGLLVAVRQADVTPTVERLGAPLPFRTDNHTVGNA